MGARRKAVAVSARRPHPRSRLAFECVAALLDDGCPLRPYSDAAAAFSARRRASLIASAEAAALREVESSGGARTAADPVVRELARRDAMFSVHLVGFESSFNRLNRRSTEDVRAFLIERGRNGWEFPRRVAVDVIGAAYLAGDHPDRTFEPIAHLMNDGIPTGAADLDGDHIRNAVNRAERVVLQQLSALNRHLTSEKAVAELAYLWLSDADRRRALYRQATELRLSLDGFVKLFLSGEAFEWIDRWQAGFAGPDRDALQRATGRILRLAITANRSEIAPLEAEVLRRGIDLRAFEVHA
jgi:hypothetical protein